jgi:hypothetical protein
MEMKVNGQTASNLAIQVAYNPSLSLDRLFGSPLFSYLLTPAMRLAPQFSTAFGQPAAILR